MTNKNKAQANNTVLTSERILSLLKGTQKIAVDWSKPCFEEFVKSFHDALASVSERSKSNQEQERYFEYQRELKQKSEKFSHHFCAYLGEGYVKFKKKTLDTRTGEEKYSVDMLSLVENEDLEETIAISSITQRMENQYADVIWALNQRFSLLNGGSKVYDRSNPVGPVQFCESLRKALQLFDYNTDIKILAYKVFDDVFMPHLQEVLQETNQYLKSAGILKNLRQVFESAEPRPTPPVMPSVKGYVDPVEPVEGHGSQSVITSAGVAAQSAVAASAAIRAAETQYPDNLVHAIHTLQSHISHDGSAQSVTAGILPSLGENSDSGQMFNTRQLVAALQGIQHQTDLQAQQNSATQLQLSNLHTQLAQQLELTAVHTSIENNDMHTIDLVGMLFEYILSDDNLPDSIKALLSYLHTPFMKIAFLDKSFFEETEHPARILLNNLAEAGSRWVGNDGSSEYDIYEKIKSIVSTILDEFTDDVRIFASLLLEFSSYTKKIARRQELMERRAMEKAEGEEKLKEVKVRVNTEVRSRTDGRELPSAVLLLLLQPWSDYLAFILLRYGDSSEAWKTSIDTIDSVIWSVQSKTSDAERTQQVDSQSELIDRLEAGFDTIGYDATKAKKLLEALVSLQARALQNKTVAAAAAPVRDKLENMAAEKSGQTAEKSDKPTPEEMKMVESLKMIEFGTWFEFNGGQRLKVSWYNARTLNYMLVDQKGKKVAMKTGLELARAMIAEEVRIIAGSSKPFFERALENIFESLRTKAAASAGDEQHG